MILFRALILRPAVVLEPNTTYTVAIRSNLRDAEGVLYTANEALPALQQAVESGERVGYLPLDREVGATRSKQVIEENGLSTTITFSFGAFIPDQGNSSRMTYSFFKIEQPSGHSVSIL